MHVHFLGICGTFMAGLALIARELGHRVTGSDENIYPPMSEGLERAGITLIHGYDPAQLSPAPDVVVIGNAMTRGNPCVEYILDTGLKYTSGPAWLSEQVLAPRRVIAVAGTHGKTTTTAMLALILDKAGLDPGFLIAGVPLDFDTGARLGNDPSRWFVIEADEYDTAFFDKRSKFIHYRPHILVLNNLEFDHADIFDDLRHIQRQFHHVVRIVPGCGHIVAGTDGALEETLAMGCWTPVERVGDGGDWSAHPMNARRFAVHHRGRIVAEVDWAQRGAHNVSNALAAIAAARHAGIDPQTAARALAGFTGVKRRLELRATVAGITLYDDFAHHPTAIAASIDALRNDHEGRVMAAFEPASNTMQLGSHRTTLGPALAGADITWVFTSAQVRWDIHALEHEEADIRVRDDLDTIVRECCDEVRAGDAILVMSNAGFGGVQERLTAALQARA